MDKEYIFVPKLYPMGALTFSIACSVCKNKDSEFCEECKCEIESHFELKTTADSRKNIGFKTSKEQVNVLIDRKKKENEYA